MSSGGGLGALPRAALTGRRPATCGLLSPDMTPAVVVGGARHYDVADRVASGSALCAVWVRAKEGPGTAVGSGRAAG